MISLQITDNNLELLMVEPSDTLWFSEFLTHILRTHKVEFTFQELIPMMRNRDGATLQNVIKRTLGSVYLVLDDNLDVISRFYIFSNMDLLDDNKGVKFHLSKDMLDR